MSCANQGDGQFTISTNGGYPPFDLIIEGITELTDNTEGLFTINDLQGGTYEVFITDSAGCQTLQTVNIEEPSVIDITIDYLNYVSCYGENDGLLTSSIQGGTPPYEFQWINTNSGVIMGDNQDSPAIGEGVYVLQVTDANDCIHNEQMIVVAPNEMAIELDIDQVDCYGENDGSINNVYIEGGSSPFTYFYTDLSNNTVNPNLLSEGTYIITVIDDNNCETTQQFDINQPNEPNITVAVSNTIVCGDGIIEMEAETSNNFDTQTYMWSDNSGIMYDETSNIFIANESGEYVVTAIDGNGCEAISNPVEIFVYENPIFVINGATDVFTGSIYNYYVTTEGAQYTWDIVDSEMGTINGLNNNNNIDITWELEGTAQVSLTLTDDNGCVTTELIEVTINWPTSIDEFNSNIDLSIYPNPFKNYASIDVSNPKQVPYDLYIYDLKGVIVKTFIQQTENNLLLKKDFSSGIYQVQLISSEGNRRKLIVVE